MMTVAATLPMGDWEMVSENIERDVPPSRIPGDTVEQRGPCTEASSPCGAIQVGSPASSRAGGAARPRAAAEEEEATAEKTAALLQSAATAALTLAPRLSSALQRAAAADAEATRLRASLSAAEQRIEGLQAQQLRINEGFENERRLHNSEIAKLVGDVSRRDVEISAMRGVLESFATKDMATGLGETLGLSESAGNQCAINSSKHVDLTDVAISVSSTSEGSVSSGAAGALNGSPRMCPIEFIAEVVTIMAEGTLGIEFFHKEPPYVIREVEGRSLALGCFFEGDELLTVGALRTADMPWESLRSALSVRPAVVVVRRAKAPGRDERGDSRADDLERSSEGSGSASGLFSGHVRSLTGWTRGVAARAVTVVSAAALGGGDDDSNAGSAFDDGDCPAREACSVAPAPATMEDGVSIEVRNRPFFDLVRGSMRETCLHQACDDASFQRWLREFHNERDDVWYASNYTRVYNAFRPVWDEVAITFS